MAIKINTAYKEILTSTMLNEKISSVVGGNEKVNRFDVSINTSTSVAVSPGKAYVNGCSIEETSDVRTITLDENILSNNGIVYIVLEYIHKTKTVTFACSTQVNSNMVKLATLVIKNGAITELINHESINTLNTVVGASADIEAQKIRDTIPSGFTELGQLDYDFMLNSENKVKIQGRSIAYVNGYRVEIPAGTVIDIGKAPEKESREDLLFLEAWKDSDFSKSGKLKWRIRHVANVEPAGVPTLGIGSGWRDTSYSIATGQGELSQPLTENKANPLRYFYFGKLRQTWSHPSSDIIDYGLGVCTATNSYAIPMFRLYRKPSCGKSIPFEYSQINPKVDYSKITKLFKEERVERVVSENIQGKSLVNLVDFSAFNASSSYKYDYTTNIFSVPQVDWSGWVHHKNSVLTKPSTTYTLILNVLDAPISYDIKTCLGETINDSVILANNLKAGIHKRVFTTPSNYDKFSVKLMDSQERVNGKRVQLMILEGDWTNKEIPEFFAGLKSLGEDNGNLITIKNGILSDNTYDVNDGNQKLSTFSEVTHILSDNTINPSVVANVRTGEGSATPVSQLGVKLTTNGTEKIEFTNIKGKTIQNCITSKTLAGTQVLPYYISFKQTPGLKPNTTYTLISPAFDSSKLLLYVGFNGVSGLVPYQSNNIVKFTTPDVIPNDTIYIYYNKVGSIGNDSALAEFNRLGTTNFMLLEGDYTTAPVSEIPFIEGIKSVGENEVTKEGKYPIKIKSCGKNLLDVEDFKTQASSFNSKSGIEIINDGRTCITVHSDLYYAKFEFMKGKFKERTSYTLTGEASWGPSGKQTTSLKFQYTDGTKSSTKIGSYQSNFEAQTITSDPNKTIEAIVIDYWYGGTGYFDKNSLCLTETSAKIPYEPYQASVQDIYLKAPLRSLPNGVCDEIVGNKVIRRVGKAILNGDEPWRTSTVAGQSNETAFAIDGYVDDINAKLPSANTTLPNLICDLLPRREDSYNGHAGECIVFAPPNVLFIRIAKSKLPSQTVDGLRTLLSSNPITIYYELATPTEEYLENVYEKESIKTYQLDAPLRSLPNGVKDEIKGGILTRRCGEMILDGSSDEKFRKNHETANYTAYYVETTPKNYRLSSELLSDKIKQSDVLSNELGLFSAGYPFVYVKIPKGTTPNDYFKANPVKIIYQLANPVVIRLVEDKPNVTNFSAQRQFAKGNWLRELPSGVKDTVENGKVKRRIGKITLNGSEGWMQGVNTSTKCKWYYMSQLPDAIGNSTKITWLADKLDCEHSSNLLKRYNAEEDFTAIGLNGAGHFEVVVSNDVLAGLEFTDWLSRNPITVLYELSVHTEEAITDKNCASYPYHNINTYCGCLYIGQGRNYITCDNKKLDHNPVTVDTGFRKIEGKSKIEDCKYKKCDDGYDTAYIGSGTINVVDLSGVPSNRIEGDYIKFNTQGNTGSSMFVGVYPADVTTNYLSHPTKYDDVFTTGQARKYRLLLGINGNVVDDKIWVDLNLEPYTTYYKKVVCEKLHHNSCKFKNIIICKGDKAPGYVPHIPTTKYLENIAENDIEDLRHQVSLTGFNYDRILNESFDKLLRGEL